MPLNPQMQALYDRLGRHLADIAAQFTDVPVKLTLLVRAPDHPAGDWDVLMTDDDPEAAAAALVKAAQREPIVEAGTPREPPNPLCACIGACLATGRCPLMSDN